MDASTVFRIRVSPQPRGRKRCLLLGLPLVAAGETKVGSDGEVSKSSKKPKRFMFDGLRSHLKEK